MIKVLALGYLPKWKGGRQQSGLATGLFDLHDSVNSLGAGVKVVLAATDVFKPEMMVDNTKVLGWTKGIIVKHALKRFYRLPKFCSGARKISKGSKIMSFSEVLVKLIFLDYAINRERPDVIHLHACVYALYANYIWNKSIPVVLRLHGINGYDEAIEHYEEYRRIEKAITNLDFKFVTFVTNSIKKEWEEHYGPFKCKMVGLINGYNPNVFRVTEKSPEKKYDLITFAGISERKGQGRVMEAMVMAKKDSKNLSYLIIGGGADEAYKKKIEEFAAENILDVKFMSYCPQNELPDLIAECRYFILPSTTEGFGKVYIESIASGVPVILPKTLPIVKESIFNEKNSILTDDSSAEGIYAVIKNLPKVKNTPEDIAQTVDYLKWTNLAKEYIELYKGLGK